MSKALIIEDDPLYHKMYKRKLVVSGFDVKVAEDCETGIQLMRQFQPDIVFVALMMSKTDGFHFLDTVKSDPLIKNIPVIVLTSLPTTDDAQKVLQKGALDVMVKSDAEPNTVVEKARQVLAASQGQPGASSAYQ